MKIPEPERTIQSLIDQHHEGKKSKPRPHMGVSQLGHVCDRWLWLSFRWAVQPSFPGRILRLFRRGQDEEATIIHDLRAIGMQLRGLVDGKQIQVSFGSHVSGSLDAIIDSGVPTAAKTKHVAEFKTHSKKSFDNLVKHGVEKSKWQHYIQMQVYMLGTGIDRALYVAVCKDDDRMHTERVRIDKPLAEKYIERGQRIALSDRMPPPISTDPSWHECKFCDAHTFCHKSKLTQHVSCRTCAFSTATADSTFNCERHHADNIPVDFQHTGCVDHVMHMDLVPWRLDQDKSTETEAVWIVDGKPLANGNAPGAFKSVEILSNMAACINIDKEPVLAAIRQQFSATISEFEDEDLPF